MKTKSTSTENERRNLRYPSSESEVVTIVRVTSNGEETSVAALVIDESHTGLGCVLLGSELEKDEICWHQETENIRSELVASHSHQIEDNVQRVGFKRTGKISRD